MALLLAGLPVEVPGQTVNRLCGSGLQAVASAAQAIRAGEGDVFIAGGVESMSRAPWVMLKPEDGVSANAAGDGGHDHRLAVRQSAHAHGVDDLAGRDGGGGGRAATGSRARSRTRSRTRASSARSERSPRTASAMSSCPWRFRRSQDRLS